MRRAKPTFILQRTRNLIILSSPTVSAFRKLKQFVRLPVQCPDGQLMGASFHRASELIIGHNNIFFLKLLKLVDYDPLIWLFRSVRISAWLVGNFVQEVNPSEGEQVSWTEASIQLGKFSDLTLSRPILHNRQLDLSLTIRGGCLSFPSGVSQFFEILLFWGEGEGTLSIFGPLRPISK